MTTKTKPLTPQMLAEITYKQLQEEHMATKTREEMIANATFLELQWLVQNPSLLNLVKVSEFFAQGGFHICTDKQLVASSALESFRAELNKGETKQ